jgi:hypothetical protein
MFDDLGHDDGTSCSSLTSCDGESEIYSDFGLELDPSDDDLDEVSFEAESALSGGDSKRRRVDKKIGQPRTGLLDPAAAHRVQDTLIIFDWDDTLCPSTWLQMQGLQITPGSPIPTQEQKADLGKVARCVIRTLRRAKRLGHVIIVTNGERGWVELSCGKFLPEVGPLLEGIKVVSANSMFKHTRPQSPVHWKRLAFRAEITSFCQARQMFADTGCQKHMVSVGDSMQERTALMEAMEVRNDCWGKSMKLLERPSPDQLVKQHELLRNCLRPFVEYEGSLDMCLEVPSCSEPYHTHLN